LLKQRLGVRKHRERKEKNKGIKGTGGKEKETGLFLEEKEQKGEFRRSGASRERAFSWEKFFFHGRVNCESGERPLDRRKRT